MTSRLIDRMNAAAKKTGEPFPGSKKRCNWASHLDIDALGRPTPAPKPRMTAHIWQIIDMLERLTTGGQTYEIGGHVLSRTSSCPAHNAPPGPNRDEMVSITRGWSRRFEEGPGRLRHLEVLDSGLAGLGEVEGSRVTLQHL